MKRITLLISLFSVLMILVSCESEAERKIRLEKEQKAKLEQIRQKQREDSLKRVRLEKERIEREIYNKYINNSLFTGATPYSYCYGNSNSCTGYGCSEIRVKTPYNSDVIVTIKKNNKVFRHAYIRKSDDYTFRVPEGTYQVFFYYGKGWNSDKIMKKATCGNIKGGFIDKESFGKDDPVYLNNNILVYELILQENGNFSTRPSSKEEAF